MSVQFDYPNMSGEHRRMILFLLHFSSFCLSDETSVHHRLLQQPTQLPLPVPPPIPATQNVLPTPPQTQQSCNDKRQCSYWTKNGFCNHTFYNDHYRMQKCANACGLCLSTSKRAGGCIDTIQQCSSYVSLGYCNTAGGQQSCCATCSQAAQKLPTAPQPGGTDIVSILGSLAGLIPGLGGAGRGGGGGQQLQQPTTNPFGTLGPIFGELTGGGSNPLSELGNAVGGGSDSLSGVTNGLAQIRNLANLAGMLG